MATWQAVYWLVPMEDEVSDPERAWVGVEHATELLAAAFDQLLPRSEGWSPEMRHWGAFESHDVKAWFEAGRVVGIQLRIDLRSADLAEIIPKLAETGMTLGAAFLDERNVAILPDPAALRQSLALSPAAAFVADPTTYLARLRERAV